MATVLKIIFVGDGCSGKTRSIHNLLGFAHGRSPYKPTQGAQVYRYTNKNFTKLDIWDCGGTFCGFRDAYFIDAEICVLFGSNQYTWMRDVKRIAGDIIFYSYENDKALSNFIESINNLGPVAHVSNKDETVVNVFN